MSTRRLHALAVTSLLLGAVTGCGGGTAPNPHAAAPAIRQPAACSPGHAFMGCNATRPSLAPKLSFGSAPAGRYFVDVSSWQGHPNWTVAKSHIAGAVDKLGEYGLDPTASYNIGQQRRLDIPFAAYWFIRPTGCAHEGNLIASYAKAYHVPKIILDEETGGIAGYAACINPYVRAATGQDAAVYRSAGTNFDSSAPGLGCWVAAYGPSIVPSCGGRPIKAFQFTDGRYGFPIYIPGVGQGDVSVNLGLFPAVKPKPPAPKPKPKPKPRPAKHCLARHWPNTPACHHVRYRVHRLEQQLAAIRKSQA